MVQQRLMEGHKWLLVWMNPRVSGPVTEQLHVWGAPVFILAEMKRDAARRVRRWPQAPDRAFY